MKSKVIIFPTDTVYGIGTSVYDKENIKRIYDIKKRPLDKPLAVLCANIDQINEIAYLNECAIKLINKFMPGPLTIIVPAKDNIKESMNLSTVGIRIPNYKKAIELLEEYGPLATTSVNESGLSPINDYEQIKEEYSDLVDEIIKPSSLEFSCISSTVVDITTDNIKVLRQGSILISDIENALK